MTPSDEEDLAMRLDRLEADLRELQETLEGTRRPRGRPPTPSELLRLTDERGIPALIAVFEAQIRALELLQGTIRLVTPEAPVEENERIGRAVVRQLDAVVNELRTTPLPAEAEPRRLIEDAIALREEISARISETPDADPEPTPVEIDIDEELDAIRSDLRDDEEDGGQSTGSNR